MVLCILWRALREAGKKKQFRRVCVCVYACVWNSIRRVSTPAIIVASYYCSILPSELKLLSRAEWRGVNRLLEIYGRYIVFFIYIYIFFWIFIKYLLLHNPIQRVGENILQAWKYKLLRGNMKFECCA